MPITPEHVGRRYALPQPYQVSQAKIDEFRTAVGDPGEVEIAPATFAMVIAAQAWQQLFADAELGLSLHRTVHADQRFSFVRPLRAGDQVAAELVIDKVRNRGGADLVTVTVALSRQGSAGAADEQLCTATSTLLHTAEVAA